MATIIVPIRMNFMFTLTDAQDILQYNSPHIAKKGIAYANEDREIEFKRSIEILDDLHQRSKNMVAESLTPMEFDMPNLMKYPMALNNDWAWTRYTLPESCLIHVKMNLNLTSDMDKDGLTDFNEALLLTNALNKDTDGDGLEDNIDSDPLNKFIKSDLAEIRAAVLSHIVGDSSVVLMSNEFRSGKGEVGNWRGHIILLSNGSKQIWETIFKWRKRKLPVYCMFFEFGPCDYDLAKCIALQYFYMHNSRPENSGVVLLTRMFGKWQILGVHYFMKYEYKRNLLD